MEDDRQKTRIAFLRPRLVGERFNSHSIPLEVLQDLSVLEPMILAVARWKYLQDHPDRQRVPKGFTDGVMIKLAGVEDGSAVPLMELETPVPEQLNFDNRSYFEDARDLVIDAISTADRGETLDGVLPSHLLSYFDRMGRRIREGEAFEFPTRGGDAPATFNRRSRRNLVLASSDADELSAEASVRGTVHLIEHKTDTFGLMQANGRSIRGPLSGPHKKLVLESAVKFDEGARIQVNGIGIYSTSGRLTSIQSIDYAIALDPLDIDARIDELRALRPGWIDGSGSALSQAGLDWLSDAFRTSYPDESPSPFLYPTEAGNVRAEWELGPLEMSLEINLAQRNGAWHSLNVDSDQEASSELDLSSRAGWVELAVLVGRSEESVDGG